MAAVLSCGVLLSAMHTTFWLTAAAKIPGALIALSIWMLALLGVSRFHRLPGHAAAALAVICAIWFFQRIGFLILIPGADLVSRFFEQPAGAAAKFWVLELPYFFGVGALALSLVIALVSGYRNGQRWSLIPLLPWWLAALVVFSLPSLYLAFEGGEPVY